MFDIALMVDACLRAQTDVVVVWPIEVEGYGDWNPSGAVALTPGGGRAGVLLGGAVDVSMDDLPSSTGRVITLTISAAEAEATGRPATLRARCVASPASELPSEIWRSLLDREPVGLVTEIVEDQVIAHRVIREDSVDADDAIVDLWSKRAGGATVDEARVVTVWRPVPRMLIAGRGPMADAIAQAARLVEWGVSVIPDGPSAVAVVPSLSPLDSLVVASHDLDVAGSVLAAGVDSRAGYLGAVGSISMQQRRADWLRARGVDDLSSIHAPAGLEIGAESPAEVGLAVVAEAMSVIKRIRSSSPDEG